jgi:GMP synthase-like glutamine amidotransferase
MTPPNILIIQNDEPETLGLYETYLKEKKIPHKVFHAYKLKPRESFPSIDEYDAFIVGPTPISANDAMKHYFLKKEWSELEKMTESGKPTLGVCCGGQMLSIILGGEVKPSPSKEIGGYQVHLTNVGQNDPLFKGFPISFPVFHWHSEMFTIPPGGECLATGDPCPIQSFSKENVKGVIFHLELTSQDAKRWADAYPKEPEMIGKSIDQVIQECKMVETQMQKLCYLLMDNFLSLV